MMLVNDIPVKRDSYLVSMLVEKGRNLYFYNTLSRVEIDRILLPVLKELKNKKIWYQYRYELRCGILTGIKGEILKIREGVKKRRINIKNLQIYDEVVIAVLSLYK